MREITLRVRHHGEPESDVSADYPRLTTRSVSSITGTDGERKRIVEISGPKASIEGYLADFEASDAVFDVSSLTPLDIPNVLIDVSYDSRQWDSISQHLTNLGIHYRNGTTITGGWERWTIYLNDDDDLHTVIDSLEHAGNETDLVRSIKLDEIDERGQLELSTLVTDMTKRQREVLGTAIRLGYYNLETDVSTEDIATAIGISSSTAWEHLARSEAKVMTAIGSHLMSGSDEIVGRERDPEN